MWFVRSRRGFDTEGGNCSNNRRINEESDASSPEYATVVFSALCMNDGNGQQVTQRVFGTNFSIVGVPCIALNVSCHHEHNLVHFSAKIQAFVSGTPLLIRYWRNRRVFTE